MEDVDANMVDGIDGSDEERGVVMYCCIGMIAVVMEDVRHGDGDTQRADVVIWTDGGGRHLGMESSDD